jgi:23S rRNA (uridine2552-2'-O)-methyltransferase
MKRKKSKGRQWADHYTQQAKKDRYPARSVYKLKEIQKKYRLIKKGNRVLDLGCAPGSWLLGAAEIAGASGEVIGVDLKPVSIDLPKQVTVIIGDILNPGEALLQCLEKPYHVVLSDMAPGTTGNKEVDAARSFNLCEAALDIADRVLVSNGSFLCKIFQGQEFKTFTDMVKRRFKQQRIFKPQSSRKASKEIYVIGIGKQSLPS